MLVGMESSEEEERRFLVGVGPRVRRYGTTSTPSAARPHYYSLAYHQVEAKDSLPALALRYASSVPEIRRLNKLWSNDALHSKDILVIPVLSEGPGPSTSASASSASNGEATTTSRRQSSAKDSSAQTAKEEGVSDILSRIDATIKSTAESVEALERASTVERVLDGEGPEGSGGGGGQHAHMPSSSGYCSSSRNSSRSGSLSRASDSTLRPSMADKYDLRVSRRSRRFGDGEATDVRAESSKILASLEKLQRAAQGRRGDFEELE